MSLKSKVVGLLLGVFAIYAVVEYSVQRFVLLPSFIELERAEATANVERALEALQREAELLLPSARDWGSWDDTYQFVADGNLEYVDANLSLTALEGLGVNLLAFVDQEGRIVWAQAHDLEAGAPMEVDELSSETLGRTHPLLGDPGTNDPVAGLLQTTGGIFVVAATPILHGDGSGPSRGRVLMGRILDEAAIARLGAQARVELKAALPMPSDSSVDGTTDAKSGSPHTPIELEDFGEVTHGHATVLDVWGRPAVRFEVDTPRNIVAQGRKTLNYATLSLLGAGMVVLLLLLVLLRRTVFDPVSQLTQHAIALGTRDDLSSRLHLERSDEVGVLAREFDRMVERLAETRQRLLDQSFKSGVAEMASGVLHNIGNAVTPFDVLLTNLREELRKIPVAEIEMAAAELLNAATPDERRTDLTRFLEMAGKAVATQVKRMSDDLQSIEERTTHIVAILADQHRFSRAERVIEPVALQRVVEEAVRLLPEDFRNVMTVELDPELADLNPLRAARVALQQVVSNLLINAAESIRESAHEESTGRLRIRVLHHEEDGPGFAHLCFEDNGKGIAAEDVSRIFERGFSTKSRGSGIGLHWCANTISALGGRIYAESGEPPRGARLHLLLPLADPTIQTKEKAA